MNIDAHAHVITKTYFEALQALPGVVSRSSPYGKALVQDGRMLVPFADEWFEPDHQLRDLDRKKIDVRLVSVPPPNIYIFKPESQRDLARRLNDEMIALARSQPKRIRALASLPLGDVDAAIAEIDRIANEPEIAGLSIGSNVAGVPLSDARFEPLWARINSGRIPVVEHPVHPSFAGDMQDFNLSITIGFMYDTQLMVTRLIMNGIFERYPDFPFIVANTGAGLLGFMTRLDRTGSRHPAAKANMKKSFIEYAKGLYYDTCAFDRPTLMHACDLFGTERIMFGTDYPFIDQDTRHVEPLPVSADAKAAISSGNAARVFGMKA